MNKIKFLALLLLSSLLTVSCNDMLGDNINPDKAHEIDAKDGLPVLIYYAQQIVYDHAEYYAYFSQMLTTSGKSSVGAYSYKCEWEMITMNRHPMWRRHFYDIGKNGLNLIANSQAINSPNYELITRTIELMSTQLTTDAFGDMPRSQAYQSNAPAYDTQESVYAWMMQEADDLIALYDNPDVAQNPNNQEITFAEDRVYGGDLEKWTQNAVWSVAQPVINSWESRANLLGSAIPSKFFMVDLLGIGKPNDDKLCGLFVAEGNHDGFANDPRCGLLMIARTGPSTASITSEQVKMRFLENNIGMGTSFKLINYPDLYMGAYAGASDAYNPIFTMEELYFIKAEAEYWLGNKTLACELAKEATQWNIQRHLDFFIYPTLRRPYNLYTAYWIDGLTEAQKENTWIQRINYDPETEEKYNRSELERLGAYKNYKWLQEPMIWAHAYGEVTSLTGQ